MSNFSLYGTEVLVGLYYLEIHDLSINLNKYPCTFDSIKELLKCFLFCLSAILHIRIYAFHLQLIVSV